VIKNKLVLFLCIFIISISSGFAVYPSAEILNSPTGIENTNLTLQGWLGTTTKIEVNNNVVEASYLFSSQDITSISLTSTIDQAQINVVAGETFTFVNNAQSAVTYNLVITKGNELISRVTLTPSQVSSSIKLNEEGTYNILDENTGLQKQVIVNYGFAQRNFILPLNMLSDGINSVKLTSKSPNGEGSVSADSSFTFEKYANSITFTSENVSNTASITGTITAEDLNDDFYYIVNQDGFQSNCGSYAANKLEFTANGDEISIRNLQEGNNVVRIISTDSTCSIINGENRFEVFVDRVAPKLNLIEATFGRTGTSDSGEYDPEVFDPAQIYTNTDEITLFYDSRDITKIDYIINGREDGLLIDEQQIDKIPQIESFFVESDGSNLEITLRPYSEYTQSYITWSYDRFEDKEERVRNGEIKFSIDLKDERTFDLTFFEGDGPDVQGEEIRIFDLAYLGVGDLKTADTLNDNGLYEVELDLIDGQNNITLLAYDRSGNVKKEIKTIFIDTEEPKLVDESDFDPKPGTTVHFPIQELKGTVNKADMYIEVFTIPEGERVLDFEDEDGRTQTLSCTTYKNSIVRGIDNLNRERRSSTAINLQEVQFDLSLQSLLLNKESTRSDSEGNFEVYIGLEEESFTQSDLNDENDRTVDRSTSRNKVCIIMADRYGNIDVDEISYTLDTGNSLWKEAEITTTPNSIYAAEIEQIGDRRSGSGKVQFSMIARFQYLGSGRVDDISSFRISLDSGVDNDRFQGRGSILSSGVNYVFDKTTNELIAYVPIEISPLGEDPLEYPDEIKFNLKAVVNYNLEENDIQVDNAPIYFETLINIERPLDHTKWLTPSTINKGLEFINKTIKFTEKATDVMKYASLISVGVCTYGKFEQAVCITGAQGDQVKINECNKDFYNKCDRIAGLPSPPDGEFRSSANVEGSFFQVPDSAKNGRSGTVLSENLGSSLEIQGAQGTEDEGFIIGNIESLSFGGACITSAGSPGVLVSGTANKFDRRVNAITGGTSEVKSQDRFTRICQEASYTGYSSGMGADKIQQGLNDGSITLDSTNMQGLGSVFYNSDAPYFDNTKCSLSLYGINAPNYKNGGVPGRNPKTSIFSSVECGAVVDTYKHLQVILRVQEGIQKCLEQAKIGEIQGGYCERLVGQAVCDIATNVILPELAQRGQGTVSREEEPKGFLSYIATMRESEREFDQRYEGSALSQTGLSTDQIVNKACIGAITGDWSVLEENILSTIENAEVEPVFGPPIAESRLQGYNPLTGEIAIRYQFTYAAVSGGQSIRTKVVLICDPNAPNGEFCPEEGIVRSDQVSGSDFKQKQLTVTRDGTVQENIVINDNKARFWYNQIELTHEYDINSDSQTEITVFNIAHKSEMFGQCYWDGGLFGSGILNPSQSEGIEIGSSTVGAGSISRGGITCGTIFAEDSLISSYNIDERNTKIIPENTVFYPGNPVLVDLGFSARGSDNSEEELALAYYTSCQSNGDKPYYLGKSGDTPPQVQRLGTNGNILSSQKSIILYNTLETVGEGEDTWSIEIDSIPPGIDSLITYATSGTNSGIAYIDKVYINGNSRAIEVTDLNFLAQNLVVNGGNDISSSILNLKSLKEKLGLESIDSISIEFNGQPENVVYALGTIGEDKKIQNRNLLRPVSGGRLSEGKCTINMRILPYRQAEGLTIQDFATYSPISESDENGDLILGPRLESENNIVKKEFTIKARPSDLSSIIQTNQIVSPSKDSIIILNEGSPEFYFDMLYMNSKNQYSTGLAPKIEYELSTITVGKIGEGENTLNSKFNSLEIELDTGKVTKALESISYEDNPWGLIKSSTNSIDATLAYKITYMKKGDDDKPTIDRTITNSIPVIIVKGDFNSNTETNYNEENKIEETETRE
jgi:hypothetical protein